MKSIKVLIAVMGIIAVSALFLPSANAVANNTTTATVSATVSETISVTLSFIPTGGGIAFGSLNAGTHNNSATNNLNISIDAVTNVATNISQNGTDFTKSGGGGSFAIGNLSYSNTSGSAGLANSTLMTTSFTAPPFLNWVNIPIPDGAVNTYRDTYYWLTIPAAQTAGDYTTNIYISVTKYQG